MVQDAARKWHATRCRRSDIWWTCRNSRWWTTPFSRHSAGLPSSPTDKGLTMEYCIIAIEYRRPGLIVTRSDSDVTFVATASLGASVVFWFGKSDSRQSPCKIKCMHVQCSELYTVYIYSCTQQSIILYAIHLAHLRTVYFARYKWTHYIMQ